MIICKMVVWQLLFVKKKKPFSVPLFQVLTSFRFMVSMIICKMVVWQLLFVKKKKPFSVPLFQVLTSFRFMVSTMANSNKGMQSGSVHGPTGHYHDYMIHIFILTCSMINQSIFNYFFPKIHKIHPKKFDTTILVYLVRRLWVLCFNGKQQNLDRYFYLGRDRVKK